MNIIIFILIFCVIYCLICLGFLGIGSFYLHKATSLQEKVTQAIAEMETDLKEISDYTEEDRAKFTPEQAAEYLRKCQKLEYTQEEIMKMQATVRSNLEKTHNWLMSNPIVPVITLVKGKDWLESDEEE